MPTITKIPFYSEFDFSAESLEEDSASSKTQN